MTDAFATWRKLIEPQVRPLREAAGTTDPTDVNAIARLRDLGSADLVRAALSLASARRKSLAKFPDRAARLIADAEGVEQASALSVAAHKARRFAALNADRPIVDLACGIGGDAMALQAAGAGVVAVDRDPLRAWMTHQNAGCPAAAADVSTLALTGCLCHLDPGRRSEGKRTRSIHASEPGPETIEHVNALSAGLALKLSPAIDPGELPWPGELEFISDRGRLVQSVLWTKALASEASRRATRLENDQCHSISGEPGGPPLGPMQRYLFTVDPAVERARLLKTLCEEQGSYAVHPQLGLLTADQPVNNVWLRGFELLEKLPWRLRRVQEWLRAHDAGLVEVKTRGQAVDPDRVQKQLRGRGNTPYTVFILRWDTQRFALITRRV